MTTSLSQLPAVDNPSIGFRLWTGLDEVPGMAAANNRLRIHTGILEPIDIEGMTHRYTHLVNSDPREDCVVATKSGRTVGYGRVEWHDLVDGDRIYDHTVLVEPSAWGLGIARALNGWCERRSREIASGNPTDRRTWMAQFAFDGDTELEDAIRDAGYVAVRWDAEMLRPSLEADPGRPARGRLRDPDAHRGRAARRVRDDRRGVRRALGPVRGGRAASRRVDREPVVPPRPGGHRLEGRRAGRDGQRRARDQTRRERVRPARGRVHAPRPSPPSASREPASSRACAACATPGPPAPTSAWTPTTRTGPTRSTSRAGSVSRPAAPTTASPSNRRQPDALPFDGRPARRLRARRAGHRGPHVPPGRPRRLGAR